MPQRPECATIPVKFSKDVWNTLFFQIVLYCLLYLLLVKCAVRDSGRNCLYFYPKEYIAEAQRRGIADRDEVMKKESGL